VAPPETPLWTAERNVGHGRVFPRPDGRVQSCGGPALCRECQADEGKRATAEALWTGADDALRPAGATNEPPPSEAPVFDRAVVKAFRARDPQGAFPSNDGRLWTRVVLSEGGGHTLCAWDRDGVFHRWCEISDLAAALLRLAEDLSRARA
jgi:hypothetical protein